MTSSIDGPERQQLDAAIREVVEALHRATSLLRALAPLRSHG